MMQVAALAHSINVYWSLSVIACYYHTATNQMLSIVCATWALVCITVQVTTHLLPSLRSTFGALDDTA